MAKKKKSGATQMATRGAADSSDFVDVKDVAYAFVRLLLLLGFDKSLILDAIQNVEPPKKSRAVKVVNGNLTAWAKVLARWSQDTLFVDDDGRPRDLRLRGKGGFAELVEITLPGENVARCLEILLGAEAAIRLPNKKIRYRNRSLLASADGRIPIFVDEYLRPLLSLLITLEEGLKKKPTDNQNGAFQRSVMGFDISSKDLAELQAFVHRHGMAFIEAVDEWLGQRTRARADYPSDTARLSPYIGLYMVAIENNPLKNNK